MEHPHRHGRVDRLRRDGQLVRVGDRDPRADARVGPRQHRRREVDAEDVVAGFGGGQRDRARADAHFEHRRRRWEEPPERTDAELAAREAAARRVVLVGDALERAGLRGHRTARVPGRGASSTHRLWPGMVDAYTDRRRLTELAYADSGNLNARSALYDYEVEPFPLAEWVLSHVSLPSDGAVLDVGCGPGRYLATARRWRPRITATGLDLSLGMAREAAAIGGVRAVRG